MANKHYQIYTGTSGLVLPFPNKQYYPAEFRDKSRLTYYASLFNSIEINSSFYKIPMAKTVKKWAEEVTPDFRFTFKLWRDITHNKELFFNAEDVNRFMGVIDAAGSRKGCLLVQFPPGFTAAGSGKLKNLLDVLRQNTADPQWKIAVEFRNRSWYDEKTYDLLNRYGASLVLHDKPLSAFTSPVTEADFIYLRFHGPSGDYRGSYADAFLYEYAQYVREWEEEGKSVYVYFNNTMGDAVKNLATMNSYLFEEE